MCLGIPGQVLEVWGEQTLFTGRVDFGGAVKEVCLAYVPEVRVGEYVVVHVGFAISRIDEAEARRTLEVLAQMGDLLRQELAPEESAGQEPAIEEARP